VANIFTANAGAGPLMADGGNLFNVDLVTTATGHANLSTVALSAANWDSISSKVYKQPMLIKNAATIYGTGPQMAVNPKFLLVARANQKTAMEICTGWWCRIGPTTTTGQRYVIRESHRLFSLENGLGLRRKSLWLVMNFRQRCSRMMSTG
jgi:hypothetical protein